jgi:hypothetical protein
MLMLAIVVFGCGDDDKSTEPTDIKANRVWVEKITAMTSDEDVYVTVRCANLEPLAGIEVPLHITGSGFFIDSVSFAGSKVAKAFSTIGTVDAVEHNVGIVVIDTVPFITTGSGLLARIHLTLTQDARGQVLAIDSTTIEDGAVLRSLIYIDSSDTEIVPEFVDGEVSVLQ